jgi:hypothetical protein
MPLKRMLNESGSFEPKAVAILLEAYDGVVDELGLQSIEEKEKAAKLILRLAQSQADLDAAKLRDDAAGIMLNECATDRPKIGRVIP